ncbi:MAG: uracil-DNA glycosylase [Phycisphaerales bacterium]|nr:uracil-DNA glycosylase [Phycisphaerales bacterium]
MPDRPDDIQRRRAAQFIETSRLLGVDFVPRAVAARDEDVDDIDMHDITGPVYSKEPPRMPRKSASEPRSTKDHTAEVITSGPVRVASPKMGNEPPATAGGGAPVGVEAKAAALASLRERHDRECPHCTQATGWTHLVFGDGNPDARLMFVGEAPGAEEDKQGIPFVGRSGQKLNEMITAMGLSRETVYIANVLKSRPPNNATPTTTEADRCGVYLRQQVAIIQPDVIVTLGKPAAQLLLNSREAMGRLRGTWHEYEGIPVMPTFHPAFLLRQYTPENRRKVWSDLQKAMTRLSS